MEEVTLQYIVRVAEDFCITITYTLLQNSYLMVPICTVNAILLVELLSRASVLSCQAPR